MYVVAKNKKDAEIAFEKRYPSVFKSIMMERETVDRVTVIIPKGYKLYMVSHSTKRK
jgi:hypothetical protein